MLQLREKVLSSDQDARSAKGYESSYGYGGKFGVQKDRMDKVSWKWIELQQQLTKTI